MKALLLDVFVLVCVAWSGQSALATDCPISLKHLLLNGIGSSQGFWRYELLITSNNAGSFAIRLSVIDGGSGPGKTVFAPAVHILTQPPVSSHFVQGTYAILLFPWHSPDIQSVVVTEVTKLDTSEVTQCSSAPIVPAKADVEPSPLHFDDGALVQQSEMSASSVTPPPVRFMAGPVWPVYPLPATTLIGLNIGPSGDVAASWVFQSSGYAALDEAALRAARESAFGPPLLDGQPTTVTIIISYYYNPRERLLK